MRALRIIWKRTRNSDESAALSRMVGIPPCNVSQEQLEEDEQIKELHELEQTQAEEMARLEEAQCKREEAESVASSLR